MTESKAKRMQVVLVLADRNEQEAGRALAKYRAQVDTEIQQLQQLDEYSAHYLQTYSERKMNVRPEELIAYSQFIHRLGEARKEQRSRIERMQSSLLKLQNNWQVAHHRREAIKDLIARLEKEETLIFEKREQKEMDELVVQNYLRYQE